VRLQKSLDAEVYERSYGTLKLFCGNTKGYMQTNKADFKALLIRPGKSTSHHFHLARESIFHILQGEVRIQSVRANFDHVCTEGDTVIVEPGEDHVLSNVGGSEAVVLEIESPPHASSDKIPWQGVRQGARVPERPTGRFWRQGPNVKIKICGVRNLETALECERLGVDAVGINGIGQKGIDRVLTDSVWLRLIPTELSVFLLTDRTDPGTLAELLAATNCDTVQLQGPQNRAEVQRASEMIRGCRCKFVRTVGVPAGTTREAVMQELTQYLDIVDAILIDSGQYGGTATIADWDLTAEIRDLISKPLILAGGLNPENCGKAITKIRPWGIDVESGVERRFPIPTGGRVTAKDFTKISELVSAALRAERSP
jgi:phosphoribosylanthranilate isomerase